MKLTDNFLTPTDQSSVHYLARTNKSNRSWSCAL